MGMLMSAAYILAMDTFGPITDNAGGITEMSGAPEADTREITDKLDAVGNTTKALTKGYAVARRSLAAFLLFSAYLDKVKASREHRGGEPLTSVNLANVDVFVGGAARRHARLPLQLLAIRAVGKTARRSSSKRCAASSARSRASWTAPRARTTHACVDITARAALREMVAPGPRWPSRCRSLSACCFGYQAVAGFLMVGTIGGIMLATVLNNGGGAWDNAKKFIESGDLKDDDGNVLGKGSDAHAAAVVGDTVGDPFKDTAGPSLHVLDQAAGNDHAGARAAVHPVARVPRSPVSGRR